MAAQTHALTSKLAEAQRQLELQLQVQRERDVAASAAAAAAATAQRESFARVATAASSVAAALGPLLSDASELHALQQVAAAPCVFSKIICSCVTLALAEADSACPVGRWPGQSCTDAPPAGLVVPVPAHDGQFALAARRRTEGRPAI